MPSKTSVTLQNGSLKVEVERRGLAAHVTVKSTGETLRMAGAQPDDVMMSGRAGAVWKSFADSPVTLRRIDSRRAHARLPALGLTVRIELDGDDVVFEVAPSGRRARSRPREVLYPRHFILPTRSSAYAVFPLAQEKDVGIIVRVPLASGWLTGKYNAQTVFPPDDHRSQRYPPDRTAETAAKVARLDFLLEEADSLAEAALRFVLAQPAVSTVIPGAKSPGQVAQNVKASGKPLSEGALARIEALF